jgi:hypothetical protein
MSVQYMYAGDKNRLPVSPTRSANTYVAGRAFRAASFTDIRRMAGNRRKLKHINVTYRGASEYAELRIGTRGGLSSRRLHLTGEWPDELENPFVAILLERILRTRRLWETLAIFIWFFIWMGALFFLLPWLGNLRANADSDLSRVAIPTAMMACIVLFGVLEIAALQSSSSVVLRRASLRILPRWLREMIRTNPELAIALATLITSTVVMLLTVVLVWLTVLLL